MHFLLLMTQHKFAFRGQTNKLLFAICLYSGMTTYACALDWLEFESMEYVFDL